MSKFIKLSPLFVGVVALAAFLIYINMPAQEAQGGPQGGGDTPVVVSEASNQAFPVIVEALGTAVANESVNITAQQAETVIALAFDDGDVVEQNQVLVELNNRAERARLNELNININEARRQLARIKDLANQSAASQQLLDEQESRVETLIAQKDVAQADLEELVIRAPFSGRLGTRMVSVGSLVRPGDVITTLDDLSVVKVDFSISELHLASVANGQTIYATSVAYPGEQFIGEISNIDSRIDPITRSIQIRAELPNPDLKMRPGMLLQINIEKRVLNALVIPETALVPEGDSQFVFLINGDNKAKKTLVTVGERKPGLVQILSGLSEGDKVITEGTLRVRDGSAVRVVKG
ncbi:efflux RND transporter periplasmic adaptor subunit [Glaciecola sp. XM2]|jgi:membrane fusion protein (multidrug efflux system)|uniref:efflux RND transporter periplasmic adaptor subunit n=1 Tax=Glaciecola sp. XM2 TaxID=1914931 RepID=UPI001BDEBD2B|nr:efflux RND transporter periplasmic adaptor subunit [Glaciecola sp. XM2]MBT1450370.1 efflux RND transporter periplasmic adaptor subunit [Glaciecola sp. XM2]